MGVVTDISTGGTSLRATVSVDAGRADVALTGEIDRLTGPALTGLLEATMCAGVRHLDLQMTRVTFVDLGGLRALARAHHVAAQRRITLTLRRPTPQTRWLLQVADATALLLDGAGTPDDSKDVSPVK